MEEPLRARPLATGAAAIAAALVVQLAGAPFASADPESGPVTQKTVAALVKKSMAKKPATTTKRRVRRRASKSI